MTARTFAVLPRATHEVDDTGDLILHDAESGELVVLNAVGAATYVLLDGSRDEASVVGLLAEQFADVPRAQIAEDVRAFLDDLESRGLIETVGVTP